MLDTQTVWTMFSIHRSAHMISHFIKVVLHYNIIYVTCSILDLMYYKLLCSIKVHFGKGNPWLDSHRLHWGQPFFIIYLYFYSP